MSLPFSSGLINQASQFVPLLVGDAGVTIFEQGRHRLRNRSLKEGGYDPSQGRTPRRLTRHAREVNVTLGFLAMADVALFLEDAEECPDGGVTGRIGEILEDLGDGGLLSGVEDVHDLAFPAAEPMIAGFRRHSLLRN